MYNDCNLIILSLTTIVTSSAVYTPEYLKETMNITQQEDALEVAVNNSSTSSYRP